MARICIIGGGIGGLTTAIALRQFGFEPDIYEQAPALLDVGAAIAIWPNAMRVLQHLGLAEQILEKAGEIREIQWLDQNGRPINRISITETSSDAVPAIALHRADLQSVLLGALPPASLHLGNSLLEYIADNEAVVAHFANGNSCESDFLIGADGIHSRVRTQLLDDASPRYRGYMVWRGISQSAPKSIPPFTAVELHGCGKRFGLGPVGKDRIGWWAAANAANISPKAEERSADRTTWKLGESVPSQRPHDTKGELLRLFERWYRPAIQMIESTPSASILRTGAFDRAVSEKWGEGPATLLGDAIHPTTPNLGQGGCMAIEDGMVLARCLHKYTSSADALRTYEKLRYKRTTAVSNYSRLYGAVGQWENVFARGMRRSVLSLMPESVAQKLVKIVFDYNACEVEV